MILARLRPTGDWVVDAATPPPSARRLAGDVGGLAVAVVPPRCPGSPSPPSAQPVRPGKSARPAFTFYPELPRLALSVRIIVGVVWTAALIGAVVAVRRDQRSINSWTHLRHVYRSGRAHGRPSFRRHPRPTPRWHPPVYRVTVFLYDANVDRLRPVDPDGTDETRRSVSSLPESAHRTRLPGRGVRAGHRPQAASAVGANSPSSDHIRASRAALPR